MQQNRSKGRTPYNRSGRHSLLPASDEVETQQDSPSRRRRGFPGSRGKDSAGGTTTQSYQPQPSARLPGAEVQSKPNEIQWLEYFSPENGRRMKYNPATGEVHDVAEPNQADSDVLLEGRFVPNVERGRDPAGMSEVNVPRTPVKIEGMTKPALNSNQPSHGGPLRPHNNPNTGVPSLPSSLSPPHPPSRTLAQSGVSPSPAGGTDAKDRPVTVRDMEQFSEAIQTTIRDMGAQFIKAIAGLHQQEAGSETDNEDE